jgi:cell division septal protein FtsQ
MNLNRLIRRNRFKNRAKADKPAWQWPKFLADWRTYTRRAAILTLIIGALAALMWALDRPVQVISMDGAFQRVSPGQIEKAVAPYAHAGFMSADLDDIQRAVEAVPCTSPSSRRRRPRAGESRACSIPAANCSSGKRRTCRRNCLA